MFDMLCYEIVEKMKKGYQVKEGLVQTDGAAL